MQKIVLAILHRLLDDRPLKSLVEHQNRAFANLGFDRVASEKAVSELRNASRDSEDHNCNHMNSEHVVLFAAISQSKSKVESILEIGTFKGATTTLFAELFPQAKIKSIDLSHEEIKRQRTYAYGLNDRNITQMNIKGVRFLEMNSLLLTNDSSKYDLIWVDGNHQSPYTISDIVNSLRLITDHGYIVCDDVYLRKPLFERDVDTSTISILSALEEAGIISYDLILKRLGRRFNNFIYGRKYIAVVRKSLRKP